MRLAVLTDVHANLPALQAVLAAIADEGCDAIIHTGDAIGLGPHPAECLDLLLASGAVLLLGNHDAHFAFGEADRPYDADGLAHHRWTQDQLDPALREVVAAWPWELWIPREIAGQWLLFTHYGRTGGRFVQPPPMGVTTSVAELDEVFDGTAAEVVFYGHDHGAFDGSGDRRYVNPGLGRLLRARRGAVRDRRLRRRPHPCHATGRAVRRRLRVRRSRGAPGAAARRDPPRVLPARLEA